MPDLALDLRYLAYAILVAEHGSFRAAAERIELAQSTVSRRIQLLERRLGVTLFERGRSGTRLTATGERFIRMAVPGAEQLRHAISEARKAQRGERGELRIGIVTSLSGGLLGKLLARYKQAHPSINLRVQEVTNQKGESGLLNDRLDLAFLVAEPCSDRCKTRSLWSERGVIALPVIHPLASGPVLKWTDLRNEVLILPTSGQEGEFGHSVLKKMSIGCQAPHVSIHDLGRDSLLSLVSLGFGVFFTLESTASDAHKGVVFRPLAEDDAVVEMRVAWSEEGRNPAVQPFVKFAVAFQGGVGT